MKLIIMDYDKFKDLLDGEEYYEYRDRCGERVYTQYYNIQEDGIYVSKVDEKGWGTIRGEYDKILVSKVIDLVDIYKGNEHIEIYGYNEDNKYVKLNEKEE